MGDFGGPSRPHLDPFRNAWVALAVRAPKRRSKRCGGTERRRAPNVTHSVVWRTCVPESIGITVYFEHRIKERKLVPNRCAPDVTHNVFSWT